MGEIAKQTIETMSEPGRSWHGHRLLTTTNPHTGVVTVVDVDNPNGGTFIIDEAYLQAMEAATTREEREALIRKHWSKWFPRLPGPPGENREEDPLASLVELIEGLAGNGP